MNHNPQPHPATEPVILALAVLAEWEPTGADELARILRGLHEPGGRSVLTVLAAALSSLAAAAAGIDDLSVERARAVAGHLESAADAVSAAGLSHLDEARGATGSRWAR